MHVVGVELDRLTPRPAIVLLFRDFILLISKPLTNVAHRSVALEHRVDDESANFNLSIGVDVVRPFDVQIESLK
jgi:hypothetical protein